MLTTAVTRPRKSVRLGVVVCAVALRAAACGGGGGSGGSDQSGSAPTGKAAQGGTLTAQLTEPTFLAPAQNCYESECSTVLNLVNDKLVSVDLDTGAL